MQSYIKRLSEKIIKEDLKNFLVIAILGSRQCGKSTLAKELGKKIKKFLYLDLEKPSDLRKLDDPELFFESNKDKIFCLDEIQTKGELFPTLRSIADQYKKKGQFIILGSASRDLIEKSSESLAGRISFVELSPFSFSEINKIKGFNINKFWFRGGYPDSFLASNNNAGNRWRDSFIKTYIERDLPQLGLNISSVKLRRFFTMCAHLSGQILNSQKMGQSLGVTYHTIQSYIDIFEQSFVLRRLPPYFGNLKKRLIRSPKIYIRDSGLLHSLLEIEDINGLMGNPNVGASWEGFIIENILTELKNWKGYFYRTSSGSEVDLVLVKGQKKIAVEIKLSTAPEISRGFWQAISDLKADEAWIIAPVKDKYPIKKNVFISNLDDFFKNFQ
ncbi:ATP-binding protein [Candidatus Parcubacteria bacterium]|nr:ATP-binding protein [Candidatus Parcubacteria bacterium]